MEEAEGRRRKPRRWREEGRRPTRGGTRVPTGLEEGRVSAGFDAKLGGKKRRDEIKKVRMKFSAQFHLNSLSTKLQSYPFN